MPTLCSEQRNPTMRYLVVHRLRRDHPRFSLDRVLYHHRGHDRVLSKTRDAVLALVHRLVCSKRAFLFCLLDPEQDVSRVPRVVD